jgi:GTP cyclohydrolase II
VQLLTNNPEKVNAVRDAGIEVVNRLPLYGTLNRHNVAYVKAKVERSGHWLSDMLAGALSLK